MLSLKAHLSRYGTKHPTAFQHHDYTRRPSKVLTSVRSAISVLPSTGVQ